MKSDVTIAKEAVMKPIVEIAKELNISEDDLELYGKYKAKLSLDLLKNTDKTGKLILVTAMNPTSAGEGKTTVNVGLSMAMNALGKKTITALREPSLGPCFGIKGGAAGGGYAQVLPMEDINLHFTGDIHAMTAANNLLAAMIDNHLHQENELRIDPSRITWKRAVDMNDRALRHIVVGLGGKINGVPREEGFMITVASEIMAVVCLARDREDLRHRLARMVVAYTYDDEPVTCEDLQATGALLILLKDAIKPNLVQTIENTPAILHGGPFANIAHGCNSVVATKMALSLADYVVTEAGFGADLGAEKFFNIKARGADLKPSAVVLVSTIRALKLHGGADKKQLHVEDTLSLQKGFSNLEKQMENIGKFQVPFVVAINSFPTDTQNELKLLESLLSEKGVSYALTDVFAKGSKGALALAEKVINIAGESHFQPLYPVEDSIKEKINTIAKEIYGAKAVEFTTEAEKEIKRIEKMGKDQLPVCMAKTQYSLSDDPLKLGRPTDFTITVREVKLSAGAGFIVALCGAVMTMPGLPKKPAAQGMDLTEEGITGLF